MSDLVEGDDPFDPAVESNALEEIKRRHDTAADEAARVLRRRREAYVRVFGSGGTEEDNKIVLDDLKRFCRGEATAWHDNERVHCLMTGRQEVYQRIKDHTTLSLDALIEKLT